MRKPRVAVFISGSGSNLQALIDAAATPDYPAQVALVLSNNADAFGLERARRAGIPTTVIDHRDYDTREVYDTMLQAALAEHRIDLICLAGFMRILTAGFVQSWRGSILNIHPSLLPSYRGLHTHARALADGVRIAGCSVHFVVPELDAGPLVIQAAVPVFPHDSEATLAARVLQQEHVIYPRALRWLAEGSIRLTESGRVDFRYLTRHDGVLINPQGTE